MTSTFKKLNSHLNFKPYKWVECRTPETCEKIAHLNEDAETLNSYPIEWVQKLLGNCEITDECITFLNAKGQVHRKNGPAVEWYLGSREWWVNNKPHREDGPAVIDENGTQSWHHKGPLHRVDGPAVIRVDGTEEWYFNDELHRDNGPAITEADGTTYWYQHDALHREDGPAIKRADGSEEWYVDSELHRVDGPAVTRADGSEEWWLDGIQHSENNKEPLPEKPAKLNLLELSSESNTMTSHLVFPYQWVECKDQGTCDGITHLKHDAELLNSCSFESLSKAIGNCDLNEDYIIFSDNQRRNHREDGPAEVFADGSWRWRKESHLHRVDGPAAKEPDGTLEWWVNGKLHREDGPAIICVNGHEEWWINDEFQRENDIPAVPPHSTSYYWLKDPEDTFDIKTCNR